MTKKKKAKAKKVVRVKDSFLVKKKKDRGGRRENSGRPSIFRGKSSSSVDPMFDVEKHGMTIRLTPNGKSILDNKCARIKVSRNDLIEGLLVLYGRGITRDELIEAAR